MLSSSETDTQQQQADRDILAWLQLSISLIVGAFLAEQLFNALRFLTVYMQLCMQIYTKMCMLEVEVQASKSQITSQSTTIATENGVHKNKSEKGRSCAQFERNQARSKQSTGDLQKVDDKLLDLHACAVKYADEVHKLKDAIGTTSALTEFLPVYSNNAWWVRWLLAANIGSVHKQQYQKCDSKSNSSNLEAKTAAVIESAAALLTSHLERRKELNMPKRAHKSSTFDSLFDFPECDEIVSKWWPQGWTGTCKEGRPVYVEQLGKINVDEMLHVTTFERFLAWAAWEQERTHTYRFLATAMADLQCDDDDCDTNNRNHGAGVYQSTVVLDLKGLSVMFILKQRAILSFLRALTSPSAVIPESCRRLLIVNAPWGFASAWEKVIKFCVSSEIRDKVSIDGGIGSLKKYIPPHSCPSFQHSISCPKGVYGHVSLEQMCDPAWQRHPWNQLAIVNVMNDLGPARCMELLEADNAAAMREIKCSGWKPDVYMRYKIMDESENKSENKSKTQSETHSQDDHGTSIRSKRELPIESDNPQNQASVCVTGSSERSLQVQRTFVHKLADVLRVHRPSFFRSCSSINEDDIIEPG